MDATMISAVKDSFEAVQGDVVSVVTTALPIALGIVGLFLAIRLGIKFFKSVSK